MTFSSTLSQMSAKAGMLASRLLGLRVVLALLTFLYCIGYAFHSAVPDGNPKYPLGWWGWTDQGHYLRSALALSQFDFTSSKHFYLPLYASLGAPFVGWTQMHAFWLVDLVCLLWFAAVFIEVASSRIGRMAAVVLFFASVVANYAVFECFLIPWTSTVTTALIATAILGIHREMARAAQPAGAFAKSSGREIALFSFANGLLVLARPLDAVVGGFLWLAYVVLVWRAHRGAGLPSASAKRRLLLVTAAFMVGPAGFLAFNLVVFGTPAGGYFHAAAANGYFPLDVAEKFVSIFVDSYGLYLEPGAGILVRYPWIALSLVAMVTMLWRGDLVLRLVAVAIFLQLLLYLPYGDLMPNGTWRYLNIHYFKWMFPFFALFAWVLLADIVQSGRRHLKHALGAGLAVLLAGLMFVSLTFGFEALGNTKWVPAAGERSGTIDLPPGRDVDVIDIAGWRGGFEETYFGNHVVRLDGRRLTPVRDFRVFPAPWGIRLLFTRPSSGRSLEFEPDPRLKRGATPEVRASLLAYGITMRIPDRVLGGQDVTPFAYWPGEAINFSDHGAGDWYARSGWSIAESWGRWTDARLARLEMRLAGAPQEQLTLRLRVRAFVTQRHARQRIELRANGRNIAVMDFRLENGAASDQDVDLLLPASLIGSDGVLLLEFDMPDAAAPVDFGVGADARSLGLGLVAMSISAAGSGATK